VASIGAIVVCVLAVAPSALAQSTDDFFNPEALQRVDLLVNSRDWEKLKQNFQENTYYPADLKWNGVTVRNVGIRSRGLGSRSGTKPGLRVDMDRYASDQTFLGLKSFVLDNLTQDPSGIKETATMRLFARLGISAPRETHTRLYVNNEYAGLYAIIEAVDKKLLARVFGVIDDDTQNDGYLFEYNYILGSPWRFGYLGSDLDPYKARFDAKTKEGKSDQHKWGPIEELVRLVNDTPSSSFEATVGPRLDLAAFVKYVAAQNFVAENDGFLGYDGINNFYFYRKENSDQHVFIAWDEDNAFLQTDFPITMRHDENILMQKVMALADLRSQYFNGLLDAASSASQVDEGQSTGWLEREMRRQLDMIADAMRDDTKKPYSNDEHAAARDAMVAFAPARVVFVQCQVPATLGQARPAGCP
jgi:spore coat protein CotH